MVSASEWSEGRGRAWRDHLTGLEATLSPINRAIIDALDVRDARRLADIGCGGGGLTRDLAAASEPDAHITGFDISSDLISAARAKSGDPRLSFQQADAQTFTVTAEPFDRLSSRFGVMFFTDPNAAFRNLHSWLRPGGRMAFAVWADFADNPWMGIIREIVADYVELPQPEPDAPGPFRYAEAGSFVTLLQDCGFSDVRANDWRGNLKLGGGLPAPEAAEFGLSAFSIGQKLPSDHDNRGVAVQRLTEALRAHEVNGHVSMPSRVHLVTGSA